MNVLEIYNMALKLRIAIEKIDKNLLPESFQSFPNGSCADTSLILGTYLQKNGYGKFNLVLGERCFEEDNNVQTHAWIEKNKLIIDITADQFNDFRYKVFVSTKSIFHDTFNKNITNRVDFRIYDICTRATLTSAYQQICLKL